jgi:hypothetical protein
MPRIVEISRNLITFAEITQQQGREILVFIKQHGKEKLGRVPFLEDIWTPTSSQNIFYFSVRSIDFDLEAMSIPIYTHVNKYKLDSADAHATPALFKRLNSTRRVSFAPEISDCSEANSESSLELASETGPEFGSETEPTSPALSRLAP